MQAVPAINDHCYQRHSRGLCSKAGFQLELLVDEIDEYEGDHPHGQRDAARPYRKMVNPTEPTGSTGSKSESPSTYCG